MKLYSIALLLMMHTFGYAMLTTLPKITRVGSRYSTPALQQSLYHQSAHIAALVERFQQNNEKLYDLESAHRRLDTKYYKQRLKMRSSNYPLWKVYYQQSSDSAYGKLCDTQGEINDLTIVNMVIDKQILQLTHENLMTILRHNKHEWDKLNSAYLKLYYKRYEELGLIYKDRDSTCETFLCKTYYKILSNRTQVKLYHVMSAKDRLSTSNDKIEQQIRELNKEIEAR